MIFLAALFLIAAPREARALPNQVGGVCWDSGGAGCSQPKVQKPSLGGGGSGGAPAPSMAPAAAEALGGAIGGAIGTMLFGTPQPPPRGTPFFGQPVSPGPGAEEPPPQEEGKTAPPPKEEKKPDRTLMGVELSASPASAAPGQTVTLSARVIVFDAARTGEPFSKGGFSVAFAADPASALTLDAASVRTDDAGVATVRATLGAGVPREIRATASVDGYSDDRTIRNLAGACPGVLDARAGVPHACASQTAASADQLKSVLSRLDPYLKKTRDPDPRCPDSKGGFMCSCPADDGSPVCGKSCAGSCYRFGGDGLDGIDCSHLIAAGDPDFWSGVSGLPLECPGHAASCARKTKCPDLPSVNPCTRGTQQQLELLKSKDDDDVTDPQDLRAGDALYFQDGDDGPVEHVVQVVKDPVCSTNGAGDQICKLGIISAPGTGSPVHAINLTLTNGCYCTSRDPDTKECLQQQCIAGGGAP